MRSTSHANSSMWCIVHQQHANSISLVSPLFRHIYLRVQRAQSTYIPIICEVTLASPQAPSLQDPHSTMITPPVHLPTDMSSDIPLHMAQDILDLLPPEHYPAELPPRPAKPSLISRILRNCFVHLIAAILLVTALAVGAAGLGIYIGKTHNVVTPARVTSTITPAMSTVSAKKTIWVKPYTTTQIMTSTVSESAMPSQTGECEGKVWCNPNTGGPDN
jgi:hypothetical protein